MAGMAFSSKGFLPVGFLWMAGLALSSKGFLPAGFFCMVWATLRAGPAAASEGRSSSISDSMHGVDGAATLTLSAADPAVEGSLLKPPVRSSTNFLAKVASSMLQTLQSGWLQPLR